MLLSKSDTLYLMLFVQRYYELRNELQNRFIKGFTNLRYLELLLGEPHNDFYEFITIKLSFRTIFKRIQTEVGCDEGSVDSGQI